jgi:hypothetical protein
VPKDQVRLGAVGGFIVMVVEEVGGGGGDGGGLWVGEGAVVLPQPRVVGRPWAESMEARWSRRRGSKGRRNGEIDGCMDVSAAENCS